MQSSSHREKDFNKTLTEACTKLNAKCHASIKARIKEDAESPHLLENVDLKRFIDDIDPDLWRAVCIPAIVTKSTEKGHL